MAWKDLDRTDLDAAVRLAANFKYTASDIQDAITNGDWQAFRRSLKGITTRQKLGALTTYLELMGYSRVAHIRVDNYLNALRRGGQLPPKGWNSGQ